jgi:hypothetical protein
MLCKHPDQTNQAIDNASAVAKDKVTGHDEQIDKLAQQAKDHTSTPPESTSSPPANPPFDQLDQPVVISPTPLGRAWG